MELFYAKNIGKYATLSAEESRHCIKVMRYRRGDTIHLIDGTGKLYIGTIVDDNPRQAIVEIIEQQENFGRPAYDLTMILPPLKRHERYEWFVEKATELGVRRIIPVLTKYSERVKLRYERLERVIIAAAKQSLRGIFPELEPITEFEKILTLEAEQRFIGLCDGPQNLISAYEPGSSAIILIGPEGGFSDEEKQMALSAGFKPVRLSAFRLRAETAAIASAAVISNFYV